MASRKAHSKCKHCGHAWALHTTPTDGRCTKRMPVGWRGQGRSKRPIMGYCACPAYEPEGEA